MVIGLGVCTFNRPDYFGQCLDSLIKNNFGGATKLYVIDDCSKSEFSEQYEVLFEKALSYGFMVLKNGVNKGVGFSKNRLLKRMLSDGVEHCFLMEDDILMTNPYTCLYYIDYADKQGLHHLNFALHGSMNVGKKDYFDGVCVYPDCIGAFSYYSAHCLGVAGFIDEEFVNAWEHVEFTYRIAELGMTTPFWFFADHPASHLLLKEIEGSIDNSSIRPLDSWQSNISKGRDYWISKHGKWLPPRPSWN